MLPYLFFHLEEMSELETKATGKQEAPQLSVMQEWRVALKY